ncbi:MAG: hypothetical protein IPK35_09070 [Saprospiraceae bacterium]|jgi:predicted AAA+ superfamily ATPase|nr:hypothetical protein [Saprospiraceae bacterium]
MKIFQFILFVFISTLSFSQIKYQKDAGKIEAFPAALKAPKDAPNVILIMLDDLGFEKKNLTLQRLI